MTRLPNIDSPTRNADWIKTVGKQRGASARRAYSEDQPRDAHGRFGTGGGDDPDARWARGSHMVEQLMVTFPNADVGIDADTEQEIRSKDFGEDVLTVLGGIVTAAGSLAAEYPDVAATLGYLIIGEGQLSGAIGESLSAGAVEKYKMEGEEPYIALNIAEGLIDSEGRDPNEAIGFDVMGPRGGTADLGRLGEAMMTHEFGHLVDNDQDHGYGAWVEQSPEEAAHVSEYGSTNAQDYFAEAFTASRMGFEDRLTSADILMLADAGVPTPGAQTTETITPRAAAAPKSGPHGDDFHGSIIWEVAYGHTLVRARSAAADDTGSLVTDEYKAGVYRRCFPSAGGARVRRAYSEDQPRDYHGRFGEGGEPQPPEAAVDRTPDTLTFVYGDAAWQKTTGTEQNQEVRFDEAYKDWTFYMGSYAMREASAALMGEPSPPSYSPVDSGTIMTTMMESGKIEGQADWAVREAEGYVEGAYTMLREIAHGSGAGRDDQSLYATFRGISDVKPGSPVLDLQPGDKITWPLTSFTPDRFMAESYARSIGAGGDEPVHADGVLFRLEPGARVGDPGSNYWTDTMVEGSGGYQLVPVELVTQGRFDVVRNEIENGVRTITVHQTDVFDPDTSQYVPVPQP